MNILAVGAHWDDIEIGCGLTLWRLKERGAKLFGCVLTGSDYEIDNVGHRRSQDIAAEEGAAAFRALGMTHLPTTLQPNQRVQYNKEIMQELEAHAREQDIGAVFMHWFADHHTDHVAASAICRVAFRNVPSLLQYSSNTFFDNLQSFQTQLFCGFTAQEYQRKRELMFLYQSEWKYRSARWEREIFDRERHWGYLCGCDYAEAFMISRLRDPFNWMQ